MTDSPEISGMAAQGGTFAEALEILLGNCADLAFETTRATGEVAARFHAEEPTLPELVIRTIEAMFAVAADHDLGITRVWVDGYRPLANGHRAWGIVELSPSVRTPEWTAVESLPIVEQVDDGWEISILVGD